MSKREIVINYSREQINLGEDATTEDVTAWLDNLTSLIAEEFGANVQLVSGHTRGGRGESCADDDVNDRLRDIASGDEWIALLP